MSVVVLVWLTGHLVAISSVGGLRGSRQAPSYNASKAFQINYLEALKQKATFLNIAVSITDIRPGFVETDMAKGEGQFWVASVNKAARQIFDAILNKKEIAYIVPERKGAMILYNNTLYWYLKVENI